MSYVKTTWVTGDIVTAPKLNNLESGVEANDLNKLNKPSGNGTAGQLLISNGDGSTSWTDTDTTLEESGKAADAKSVGDALGEIDEALETKAEIDGYYEGMTVGNAEELVTGLTEEESVPYIFRTSGGSLEIGAREDLMVTGGSLAWNQIVLPIETGNWVAESGATISISNGEITISSETANNGARMKTYYDLHMHKYYLAFEAKADSLIGARVTAGGTKIQKMIPQLSAVNTYQRAETIYNNPTEGTGALYLLSSPNTTYQNLTFRNVQVIDLTALFGTTIADYIYSLEQSTAGAGVAYFKKLFPKDYYPYQAADLVHVNASEFKTVGFNQWDEQWELGTIRFSDGLKAQDDTRIRSKNNIPVLPNAVYYAKDPTNGNNMQAYFYDANGNYIGGKAWFMGEFTTPSNVAYMLFVMATSYGTTYKNDICISIHWDNTRDGEYEPYTEHSYPLDSSLVLRGIPKIDADGNLYYDGDTYEADGTVTRKYGTVTFDGSSDENWISYGDTSNAHRFYIAINDKVPAPANSVIDSSFIAYGYETVSKGQIGNVGTVGKVSASDRNSKSIIFAVSLDMSLADFKASLSSKPIYVTYALETPTTETATPYQTPQIVDNWGTEEFVVTAQNGVEVPVGHSTIYPISLRDKLEAAPDLPDDDGDFVLRMSSGGASYARLASEFPTVPTSTDGVFVLKATVTNGTATLTWEAQS